MERLNFEQRSKLGPCTGSRGRNSLPRGVASFLDSIRKSSSNEKRHLACMMLALITFLVFLPAIKFDYINFDDSAYVFRNPNVSTGVSLQNILWAFSSLHGGISYWHPLTWLSHQLDSQLFGTHPGGHHLTNIVIHGLNTVLLFLCLQQFTGHLFRSFLVAAFFGLHPLHVESVAWISERKDLLCCLFWLLTLLAYYKYANAPNARRYGLVFLFCLLAMLSKPMAVTLPFTLLLLDFWPLKRIQLEKFTLFSKEGFSVLWRCFLENAPLFFLSFLLAGLTFVAQKEVGAVASLTFLSIDDRIANALVGYLFYLEKLFWPQNLCLMYTHPFVWPPSRVCLAAVILSVITGAVLWNANRFPYLFLGWFWYLGTLIPVIGLVQVGSQAAADRYTYVPLTGIFIMLVWGARDLGGARWKGALFILAMVLLAACTMLTSKQLGYWKNTETVFQRVLKVDPGNGLAHGILGRERKVQGNYEEAILHYRIAVEKVPSEPLARVGLAETLTAQGEFEEALEHFQIAARIRPKSELIQSQLGFVFHHLGDTPRAIHHYSRALELHPDFPMANHNLASILATDPNPQFRNGPRALQLAKNACRLTRFQSHESLSILAAAHAESGDFSAAIAAAERALQIARKQGNREAAEKIETDLCLFETGTPIRAPAPLNEGNGLDQPDPSSQSNIGLTPFIHLD
jgi:protein O-mannosyl-transferase